MPYDPYRPGPFRVTADTVTIPDDRRHWSLPCQVWRPIAPQSSGLVVYSHSSGGDRASGAFLCEHLASQGYTVAAADHSERVVHDRPTERGARIAWLIENRVPDIRSLIDRLVTPGQQVGLVGHSFGGWTVLAAPEVDERIAAVVALAPGGTSQPRPGIIPATLSFRWRRPVPILVVAGDRDASMPLDGIRELFARAPAPKRLIVLRDADHMQFVDDVAAAHEEMRALPADGELAWITEMRPIAKLRAPADAQRLVRGLALAHFDATLRGETAAAQFLESVPAEV